MKDQKKKKKKNKCQKVNIVAFSELASLTLNVVSSKF